MWVSKNIEPNESDLMKEEDSRKKKALLQKDTELLTLRPWPCSPCCIWQSAPASRHTQPASASEAASAAGRPETQWGGVAVLGTGERGDGGRKKNTSMTSENSFWGKRTLKSVLKVCTATKQHERKEIQSRQRAAGQGEVASRKAKEQESMYRWWVLSTSYFNGPWQKTFGILAALSSPQINKWRRDDCWRLKENENRPK